MPRTPRLDEVFVSFHYIKRVARTGDNESVEVPITEAEFNSIQQNLQELRDSNFENDEIKEKLRFRKLAKIIAVDRAGARSISGIYKTTYWGHSFENEDYGVIDANKLNFRHFIFYLYLSEGGRLYVGSQYLGQYGGYGALKNTVLSVFSDRHGLEACSFNVALPDLSTAEPKSITISYSRRDRRIPGRNDFGNTGAITINNRDAGEGFDGEVRRSILERLGDTDRQKKAALADIVRNNILLQVADDDITDCRVLAVVNGQQKQIFVFDNNSLATKFRINCGMDDTGHPIYAECVPQIENVFGREILDRL